MNILIDIRLLARGGTTGIPGYTRELVNELIVNYPQHHYILFYNAFRKNPLPQSWRSASHVTIVQRSIPNRLLNLSYRFFKRPALPKSDVIFSPHFNLLPATTTPRVITFHDLSFIHYPNFFSRQQKFWHQMQQYSEQAKTAAHLIAVSEHTRHDLTHVLGITEEKISVIYSGISGEFKPLPKNDPGLKSFATTFGLTRPYILFFGTIEARKNPIALIRAFAQLKNNPAFKDHELVLAGGTGLHISEIKEEVRRSGVAKDIRFLGRIADENRVYLYNLARAFVLPSFFEGFGFPPLEAQACGVPVVSSGRTSLGEILNGAGESAIETSPWRPAELALALEKIEADSALRKRLIEAGIKNAARFTWKKAAEQTLAVLTKVHGKTYSH